MSSGDLKKVCESCGVTNKLPSNINSGRFKCGRCGNILMTVDNKRQSPKQKMKKCRFPIRCLDCGHFDNHDVVEVSGLTYKLMCTKCLETFYAEAFSYKRWKKSGGNPSSRSSSGYSQSSFHEKPYKRPPTKEDERLDAKRKHDEAVLLFEQGKCSEAIKVWKKHYANEGLREPKTTIKKIVSVFHKNKMAREFIYKIYDEGNYDDKFDGKLLYDLSFLAKSFDDHVYSREFLENASEKGHAQAIGYLADEMKSEGSYIDSLDYAAEAYKQGEVSTIKIIIDLLEKQEISFNKALELCSDDNLELCFDLATRYETGDSLPFDQEKAIALFRTGKSQGHKGCASKLKSFFLNGEYKPSSEVETLDLYLDLSDESHPKYQYLLGRVYEEGRLGQLKDYKKAFEFYKKAAQNCYVNAIISLAKMYQFGKGTPQNLVHAYAWYSFAASQGAKDAEIYRDNLEDEIPTPLVEKAQTLARQLKDKFC